MPKSELEIVKYPKIKHVKIFVNKVQSIEEHIHNDFEIFLVMSGNGKAKIDGKFYELQENDIFFINSGDVHSFSALDDVSKKKKGEVPAGVPLLLFFQISNHFLREYFPQIRTTLFKSGRINDLLRPNEKAHVNEFLIDAASAYFSESPYYQLEVMADVAKSLTYAYRRIEHEIINEGQKQKLKRKNARLERIISYIDANFESQIRLDDLAEMENLSVTHFSHLFSLSFGVTFQEFVNLKRMEQCIRLMESEEKTLLEISYESGFSDPKYMNKMFLKKFGCTPKEFRKNLKHYSEEFEINPGKFETILNDQMALKVLNEFKTSKIDK